MRQTPSSPDDEVLSLEAALEIVLPHIQPIADIELVPLLETAGMICAEDIRSPVDVPPFDRSPLDGFAFNSADVSGASPEKPARLLVNGTVYAGDFPRQAAGRGEAVKVMTGAMLPRGSDCVAAKESLVEDGDHIRVPEVYSPHQNYIFRGSDIQKGALLVSKGVKLDYIHGGILAAAGIGSVPTYRRLNAGLLCTGDELAEPGGVAPAGKIFNSNYALLAGRLGALGFSVNSGVTDCAPFRGEPVPDKPEEAAGLIDSRIDAFDAFISTGGVSVGERDIFHDVFTILGVKKLFWRMNFKPGMSVLCGIYRGKMLLCLSGNPFAAFVVLELLVRPVLEKLSGHSAWFARRKRAPLKTDFTKTGGVRRFARAFFDETGVSTGDRHSNGELFSLLNCNCLIDVPPKSPVLHKGDMVDIVLL